MNRAESYPVNVRRYWTAVELCLIRFHSYEDAQASEAVKEYRARLLVMKDPDLIYHEEPFYLACDISDEDLPLTKYLDDYAAVLRAAR